MCPDYRVSTVSQQVSVCIRYLRDNMTGMLNVNEEFVGFCSVPSIDAETITNAIIEVTYSCGLKMENMVCKGFDVVMCLACQRGYSGSTRMQSILLIVAITLLVLHCCKL